MEKVSELKHEPVVGKFYLVECGYYRGEWRPLIGAPHDDKEYIGLALKHYHEDVRFSAGLAAYNALAYVIDTTLVYKTELKRRKCRRRMPDQRAAKGHKNSEFNWLDKMELAFVGRKVLCGKCPHKGMPLESLPQDENGRVICNGHGLAVCMKKGEVVER